MRRHGTASWATSRRLRLGKNARRGPGHPNPVSVFTGLMPKAAELEAGDEGDKGAAVERDF